MAEIFKYGRECIICGHPILKHQASNKEHVISDWVLRLTGTRAQKLPVHIDYSDGHGRKWKKFEPATFEFPAHKACNTKLSHLLETPASDAITAFSRGDNVTPSQFGYILDWLDKTRAMLHFAVATLERNPMQFNRDRHPLGRFRCNDRAVLMFRNLGIKTLRWHGPSLPAFHLTPTSYFIQINELGCVFTTDIDLLNTLRIHHPPTNWRPAKILKIPTLVAFQSIAPRRYRNVWDSFANHGIGPTRISHYDDPKLPLHSPHLVSSPSPTSAPQERIDAQMILETIVQLRATQAAHIEILRVFDQRAQLSGFENAQKWLDQYGAFIAQQVNELAAKHPLAEHQARFARVVQNHAN